MGDLTGFNKFDDINITGLSNITADTIIVTDLSANNLTVSTSASFGNILPTSTKTPLLSTELITKAYADATYASPSGAYAALGGNNVFTGTNSFNTNLPTSTLTPTLSTQLITKSFGDTTYAQLAVANSFTEQNTFRKGILPCRGTGANPESDIQLGKNQLQYRQATSQYNISIGDLALVGSTGASFQQYNTGKRNIAVGHQSLNRLDAGNDNIFIGYQAGKDCGSAQSHGVGVTPSRCIAIGTFSQLKNLYATDSISIGYNSLVNASGPAISNICLGSNVGNGVSFQSNNVLIGGSCAPTVNDSAMTAVGYQALGAATGTFNSGTAIGWQAGYSNANGQGSTFVGAEAGYSNLTGSYHTHLGFKAGRSNAGFGTLSYTICIGYNSRATINNECVLGGELLVEQAQLTLPNKHRLSMNQSPTGVTINLTFRSNENVLITDNTTTTINLPTPAGAQNIGAKFHISRAAATANQIAIHAPSGQQIAIHNSFGTYVTGGTYNMNNTEKGVTVLCIASTGVSWLVQDHDTSVVRYNTSLSEVVLGAETTSHTVIGIAIPFKQILCANQKPTGATITLTFRTGENVIITDATTTAIQLPTPAGVQNIGAKYFIKRQSPTSNNITINAPAGHNLTFFNSSGVFTIASSYTMLANLNTLTLLCINATGNSWGVINPQYYNINDYLTTASASSTYLTQSNAASTYLTQSNAASTYQTKLLNPSTLDINIGNGVLNSSPVNAKNIIIGTGLDSDNSVNNIILGHGSQNAFTDPSNNILVGNDVLDQCSELCFSNVIIGHGSAELMTDSEENTFIGHRVETTNSVNTRCSALGAYTSFFDGATESTCIGYGSTTFKSNQIAIGRNTEEVYIPGTLQVSSVSAISSNITINNNIIHKKYYLSMVNPTVLTGTSPLTMSAPIYEYVQVNLASGVIQLPLSSDVEIGTVIRFRRITTMTGAISLEIQTGSGQGILERNGVTPVSITTFLAANVTYGSIVFLSSNLWAIND